MIHKTQGRKAQFTGFSYGVNKNVILLETKNLPLFSLELTKDEALKLAKDLIGMALVKVGA